ncbi:MAG TPA: diguanylate cyclase [Luteimonas sp.]|nr:diguanylate cyclase [Luteimonas sp.]
MTGMALANGDRRHGNAAPAPGGDASRRLPLHRTVYPFRILGMGLSGLPVGAVLWQLQATAATWALLVFTTLLWPHLALLWSRRSADPDRTERRNLLLDSVIAGLWVPMMHFNLLPCALILTLATVDKINTGVRGLWLRSLPGMLGAAVAGGLWTGFAFAPATDMPVIVACMPILVIHTVAVSLNGNRLVRRVHAQNLRLDELSRTDPLTGLDNRRQWEEHALRLLQRCRDGHGPASLVMVDVDGFKATNDGRGHAIGDDVLRGVAQALRACIGEHDRAGRYGGDEFVVAMAADEARAVAVAECIRTHVRNLAFPAAPGLRCTVSLGVAAAARGTSLRRWMVAADAALYRAKDQGRDRVATPAHGDEEIAASAV